MKNNKAELRPAYEWTCDACGRDNFVGGVIVEVDEQMRDDLIKSGLGDPPMLETGHWQTTPDEVTCAHCGEEFEAEDFSSLELEETPADAIEPQNDDREVYVLIRRISKHKIRGYDSFLIPWGTWLGVVVEDLLETVEEGEEVTLEFKVLKLSETELQEYCEQNSIGYVRGD